MCGGSGSILGALAGGALAYATGGASLGFTSLAAGTAGAAAAGAAAGAMAGDTLIDKPQQMKSAMDQQQTAANQAVAQAQKQAEQAAKANQDIVAAFSKQQDAQANQPDFAARLYRNKQQPGASLTGPATMLTGPQGIDVASLNLGRNTLLGA